MKSSQTSPLLEIIKEKDYTDGTTAIAKFKGKLLHPEVIQYCDRSSVTVQMPAEMLLDFKTGEFPDKMSLSVGISEGECLGLLTEVRVYRVKKNLKMDFGFDVDEEKPPTSMLNPFALFPLLVQLIRKEKYEVITYGAEPFAIDVPLLVPSRDNVYSHYKKHLAVFEDMCRKIEGDIMKRISKRLKKK